MNINDIKPYEKNAKKHPKKQIQQVANSIKEFGFNQPIVVDKEGVIIVGHGRLEAAKLLGLKEVPTITVNLSEEQANAYRLADNKLNESEWDMKLVIDELKGLSDEIFDLTGFDKDLIIEPDEKDDIIPEVVEPQSKLGDLYELGNHRVLCGDSTKVEDVERLMDGKIANILFTSPPYNAGDNTLGGNKNKVNSKYESYNDDKTQDEWKSLINTTISIARNYSLYQFYNIQQLAGNKKALWQFVNENVDYLADVAVWYKGGGQPAMAKNCMNSRYEYIFIFSKELNPSRSIKTADFHGSVSNVVQLEKKEKNESSKIHAATFPVEFPTHFIKNFTQINSIVLDNFVGVGTTLIACEKTGRICYGMELDPKYVDVIVQRYVDYTGNEKVKKNGEEIIWKKTK